LHGKSIGFSPGGFLYRLFGKKYGMKSIQISHSDSFFRMMERGRLSGFFTSYLFVDNFFKEDLVNGKINANWLQRLGIELR
jgi:hypothetical protein